MSHKKSRFFSLIDDVAPCVLTIHWQYNCFELHSFSYNKKVN